MMQKVYISLLISALLLLLNSCLVVKHDDETQITTKIVLSPKPEIELSDEIVRSKSGDMIAFIPKGWLFVDVGDKVSSDVFSIVVNPEHTISMVFSNIRKSEQVTSIYEKEGLLGLARLSLARRERKTSGSIKQIGKYLQVELGNNSFAKYDYTSSGGALVTRVAVFASSLNEFYEFSLVPMDITGTKLPPAEEIDKIFRSVLTTIKY